MSSPDEPLRLEDLVTDWEIVEINMAPDSPAHYHYGAHCLACTVCRTTNRWCRIGLYLWAFEGGRLSTFPYTRDRVDWTAR